MLWGIILTPLHTRMVGDPPRACSSDVLLRSAMALWEHPPGVLGGHKYYRVGSISLVDLLALDDRLGGGPHGRSEWSAVGSKREPSNLQNTERHQMIVKPLSHGWWKWWRWCYNQPVSNRRCILARLDNSHCQRSSFPAGYWLPEAASLGCG